MLGECRGSSRGDTCVGGVQRKLWGGHLCWGSAGGTPVLGECIVLKFIDKLSCLVPLLGIINY